MRREYLSVSLIMEKARQPRRVCRAAVQARAYPRVAGAPPAANLFMRRTATKVATLTPNTIQKTDEMDCAKASWRIAARPDGEPARSAERSEAKGLNWMDRRSETRRASPSLRRKV